MGLAVSCCTVMAISRLRHRCLAGINKDGRADQTPNAANDVVFVSKQLGQARPLRYSISIICRIVTQDACMAAHLNTRSIDRQRWDHTSISRLETSLDNARGHSAFLRSLHSPHSAPTDCSLSWSNTGRVSQAGMTAAVPDRAAILAVRSGRPVSHPLPARPTPSPVCHPTIRGTPM